MKKIIITVFALLTLVFLSACGSGADDNGDDEKLRVMVSADAGATVNGENPVEVDVGEDVTFQVDVGSEYAFVSVSHGVYDEKTGKLTVENVTEDMNVYFITEHLGYDTGKTVTYKFVGDPLDKTSKESNSALNLGSEITVTAGNTSRIFVGWSFGGKESSGKAIVSKDRSYTFRLSPELGEGDVITLFANYKDSNIYFYHPNGGEINTDSVNMTSTDYYTAKMDGERVKVTVGEKYFSFANGVASFWDDGTFRRDGYVLIEYNTKPDGTGEAFSLGSKLYTASSNDYVTLYCIWAEESSASAFSTADHSYPRPSGVKAENSPDWNESGVIINGYSGNDETVVIPEMINGKPVIAIAKDAFKNKDVKTLVLSKNLLSVEAGAFVGCSALSKIYFSDSIYSISNEAFDASAYSALKNLYVNATMAPRYSNSADGAFSVKLSKLLATEAQNRIIVIAGSSTYQGLATEYLEALLDNEYAVINFGTTRTTHGMIYLEAMKQYAHEGDLIIYAPENSSYMLGESELYWKTLRDLEGMNNFFRYIDISGYTNIFGAFSDFNSNYRYKRAPRAYEEICTVTALNSDGDYQNEKREKYVDDSFYTDTYFLTFNNRCKSKNDVNWNSPDQEKYKDHTDPENPTWCSFDEDVYVKLMNHSINEAKKSGAKVYFGYAPADASALIDEAKNTAWLSAYDKLIGDTYEFDGAIGTAADYVYAHEYFYDCAFHPNDYGRVYRTYDLYFDICDALGTVQKYTVTSLGTEFEGCLFESGTSPSYTVDFLN